MARNIVHLPNKTAYDLWAPIYDSDGNILQSLDTLGLRDVLLPRFISSIKDRASAIREQCGHLPPLRITDLGCGTGRTILALMEALQSPRNRKDCVRILSAQLEGQTHPREIHIRGLDASEGMLKVARSSPQLSPVRTISMEYPASITDSVMTRPVDVTVRTAFETYDIQSPLNLAKSPVPADAIICSLVVEHLPSMHDFFAHLIKAKLIRPSGLLLLSNMHPDMAKGASPTSAAEAVDTTTGRLITSAGFIDPATGNKIRPAGGWAHTIPQVLEAATAHGFELVGNDVMEEMRVEPWMLEQGVVDRKRGEKWARGGVTCWFGGVFRYIEKY